MIFYYGYGTITFLTRPSLAEPRSSNWQQGEGEGGEGEGGEGEGEGEGGEKP